MLNREYETLKSRQFRARRGRNNRIFYRSMAKSVFDYDSELEEIEGPVKRRKKDDQNYLTKLMENQRELVEDIEKHCTSKRLKKYMYKLDCIRLGGLKQDGVTLATSEPDPLRSSLNDPVIDHLFKLHNATNYQAIWQDCAYEHLALRGMHPDRVFEGDMS
mgnify:FL=1|jgi:hypothetical protein